MGVFKNLAAMLCMLMTLGQAVAGQACEEKAPAAHSVQQAFRAAYRVHASLEQTSPRVALLARVGQDLSKHGLHYSHMALVHRSGPASPWRVKHLLNACGTDQSALWEEGLANFFLDDPLSYDALLIVPGPALQERLWAAVQDRGRLHRLHQERYNMVAFAFSTRYQNSNQWVLEVLASSVTGQSLGDARTSAQQWLRSTGYEPTTLQLGTFTRLGGRMFRANVAFDDHPPERRFAGLIDTITVESVAAHLQRTDPQTQLMLIGDPGPDRQ
jgi:hypothetical protein